MSTFKEKKPQDSDIKPLVFVNQPIKDPENDIVGFSSQVATICEAVKSGSSMIGIVSDYGTGKSSITALLSNAVTKEPYNYPRPIKINMWDCLQNSKNHPEENECAVEREVSELTKSFLYQLAEGTNKKHHFSSYINKRLSKNYGTISFSSSSHKFWIFFLIAALFYTVYTICSNSAARFNCIIGPIWFLKTLRLCEILSPMFLVISILFLIWGMIDTCLVFSHWKMQDTRETEVNDVFDVYAQIIEHIKPHGFFKKNKKQIIIIEDLDRVVEKTIIVGFLKELYRFQNFMQHDIDKFSFIVSIKPETMLKNKKATLEIDDDKVYSKLFDVVIPLKPIHYDDYDSILLKLINGDKEKKTRLERIIGEKISIDKIPNSFYWIKKGENLTLRDLKDRLNHALMIMSSRKSYHVKTAVTFEACAAVTYLESRYPEDYYALIKQESAFAKLMSDSVDIINSNNANDAYLVLKDAFVEQFEKLNNDFISDLCTLILDGVFNYDFRMYFYTYPVGSHIKTTEERKLCDMLLFPTKFHEYDDLDKITEMVYAEGNENIVTETIRGLSEYPEVILMNEKLLEMACNINHNMVSSSINKYIIKPIAIDDFAVRFWTRVYNVKFERKAEFIKSLVKYLVASFSIPEEIILTRTYIIKAYGKDVLVFKDIFFKHDNKNIPLIGKKEIELINDIDISIELIDEENLSLANFDYISNLLCSEKLIKKSFEKALTIMKLYSKKHIKAFSRMMLVFMDLNGYSDDDLFKQICKDCDKNALIKYLNTLDADLISDAYLNMIEELGFEEGLAEDILKRLVLGKSYHCALLAASKSKNFGLSDAHLENTVEILDACKWVHNNFPSHIFWIRHYICIEKNDRRYFELFFDPFPLITKDEYIGFANVSDAIDCINTFMVNKSNYRELLGFIYERTYNEIDIIRLMQQLFDSEKFSNNITSDEDLLQDFVSDFDFKLIGISKLSIENREVVYSLVKPGFELMELSLEDRLRRFGCLVPSIENELSDDDLYPSLIGEMDEFTPYTLNWLEKNYITIPLSKKLSSKLREVDDYENYIISSVLRENNMVIDPEIPRECYLNVYLRITEMYEIMSDHWDFLEGLQNTKDIEKLFASERWKKIVPPIYKVPQHSVFFNYILNGDFSVDFKTNYLDNIGKFASEDDSRSFQITICKQENMELMGNEDRYWRIWNNFWQPPHKSVFTKKWKERWESEIALM